MIVYIISMHAYASIGRKLCFLWGDDQLDNGDMSSITASVSHEF